MITPKQISIERALAREQRTMQRQTLLKKLWKLQRSPATDNEKIATVSDGANRRAPCTERSRTLPKNDETVVLKA